MRMGEVVVYPMTGEDLPCVEAMYQIFVPLDAAFGLPPSNSFRRQVWLESMSERAWNWIARDGEQVIGHLILAREDGKAEMAFFVHQDWRRRGVGRLMWQSAREEAQRAGLARVWGLVRGDNYPCIAALRSFGFRVTLSQGAEVELALEIPAAAMAPAA